jgi:hypothetical protein
MVDLGDKIDIEKDLIETINFSSQSELDSQVDVLNKLEIDHCNSTKAMWKIYRLVNANGNSAIMIRVHHAIGDGISLIGCMSKFFTDENGAGVKLDIPEKIGGGVNRKMNFQMVFKFVKSFVEVLALAASSFDSDIAFTSPKKSSMVMTGRRKSIYFPILNLEFVKDLKNSARVTVNDVLMAAMCGAIKRYCVLKNDPLVTNAAKKLISRALLPVAFPRSSKSVNTPSNSLRNLWSFVSAPLPINAKSSKERVSVCAKATKALKSSPLALVQLLIQNNVVCLLPEFMQRQIAHDVFSRHTMVFSNLPGPAKPIFIGEEQVLGFQIMFPNLIPQVLLISYNGGVHCNMSLDPELVDLCDELPRLYLEELLELAASYGINSDLSYVLQGAEGVNARLIAASAAASK